ncbi:metallophosphoesterase [Rhizobium leguminosarum]|nr:metallophosphoesterase [Rhizobium leguminosarum]UIL26924.1 metallophosphoesterase [Rhizobium leguminosarum]
MKLWILSDLHLDISGLAKLDIPEADVCVVAGDIFTRGVVPSLRWLDDRITDHMPVVFVAGNHEFYHGEIVQGHIAATRYDARGDLYYLENGCVEIDGVVFAGATLWTDFDLFGPEWSQRGMQNAADAMNDFRLIAFGDEPSQRFKPIHSLKIHQESRRFLDGVLAKYRDQKVVFVTHHAPSMLSVEEKYRTDLLTTAFASNLEDLMALGGPALWIHGHVHHFVDYTINDTRVIANPRGYPREECYRQFDPGFVIEV